MRPPRTLLLLLLLLLLLAVPRVAAGQGAIAVGVVGDGCVCPSPSEVAEEIRRQSRSLTLVVGDVLPGYSVVRVSDHGSSFTVEVDGVERELFDARRNCSERAVAAAVVAVVMLEPPDVAEALASPPPPADSSAPSHVAPSPPAGSPATMTRNSPSPAAVAPSPGRGRVTLRLSMGTGMAVLFAGSDFDHAYVTGPDGKVYQASISSTSVAADWLHFAFELGFKVTGRINLSAQLRLGVPIGANAQSWPRTHDSQAGIAEAGLVRVRYGFGDRRLRPYVHAGAGYGFLRPVASVGSAGDQKMPVPGGTATSIPGTCIDRSNCHDTVTTGGLLLSAGGGFSYDLFRGVRRGVSLYLDLDALGAVPVGSAYQPGLEISLSGGLAVDFL